MEGLVRWIFGSPRILQPEITDAEMDLVRASWRKVEPNKLEHGILLFQRLFEIAPQVQDLFPFGRDPTSPMLRSHALGVMNSVGTAVQLLDRPDQLVPVLQGLGQSHSIFELGAKEFKIVGESLLWVLETQLGQEFTPETRAAWGTVYNFLADTMLEGIKN